MLGGHQQVTTKKRLRCPPRPERPSRSLQPVAGPPPRWVHPAQGAQMACRSGRWKVGDARLSFHRAARIVAGGKHSVQEAAFPQPSLPGVSQQRHPLREGNQDVEPCRRPLLFLPMAADARAKLRPFSRRRFDSARFGPFVSVPLARGIGDIGIIIPIELRSRKEAGNGLCHALSSNSWRFSTRILALT